MIAFDIDFAEPDRTSPKIAAAFACQKRVGTEKAEELLAALPDPDQRLVEAMAEAPVVTGFILTDRGEARPPLPKAGFALVGTIRSVKLLSGGGFEFAGPRSCGSWRRIPEPICRLGPRRPPDSTDFAARQQALSVALRRDAPGRPRRVQLCWPWGWCQRRKELRRKDRVDGDRYRTAGDTDRPCRPRVAALRAAAARFLASVYDLYRHRIAQFQIEVPPANWDGVFTAEEK